MPLNIIKYLRRLGGSFFTESCPIQMGRVVIGPSCAAPNENTFLYVQLGIAYLS